MDPTKQEEDFILAWAERIKQSRKAVEDGVSDSVEWRKLEPTENQIKFLKEKQYAVEGLTRGQASEIIDRIFKEARR